MTFQDLKPKSRGYGRTGEEKKKNKGKFTGTYVVIGGFEMDRCEVVARDEIFF